MCSVITIGEFQLAINCLILAMTKEPMKTNHSLLEAERGRTNSDLNDVHKTGLARQPPRALS